MYIYRNINTGEVIKNFTTILNLTTDINWKWGYNPIAVMDDNFVINPNHTITIIIDITAIGYIR